MKNIKQTENANSTCNRNMKPMQRTKIATEITMQPMQTNPTMQPMPAGGRVEPVPAGGQADFGARDI